MPTTHPTLLRWPSAFFCERSLTICLIPIRYPTHRELYTLCALSRLLFRPVPRLDRHRDAAGIFSSRLSSAPSRTAHRYVGRRREMGLWSISPRTTRQMRDIFLWCVSFRFRLIFPRTTLFPSLRDVHSIFFSSQVLTASPRSSRHY